MLHLHCSNRFEVLAELLADRVSQAGSDPFAPEHVIVPSAAIRRAISLHLADRQGICANLHFAFPAEWLWARVAAVVPGVQSESPYAARRLGWRLHALLSAPEFTHPEDRLSENRLSGLSENRLSDYLRHCDELMRHDLAMRLGALFEQYTTYRPEWLAHWENGRLALPDQACAQARADERWQAGLWRALQARIAPTCADPVAAFLGALQSQTPSQWLAAGHPARVHLLAPSSMPPLHARLLSALGRVMDIHLLVINPCQEYWFDLVDARRLTHLRQRGQAAGHEEGHPLLASWGQQTQAHLGVLVEAFADHMTDEGGYQASNPSTLLGTLQNSLLMLDPPRPGAWSVAPDDHSIEIHACHSLSRQLEVLHERLLTLFSESSGSLGPADVLVVIPDLRAAAPLIEAIFGTVPDERHLPYSISGLPEVDTQALARTLLDLLRFASGRGEVRALLDLLRQDGIRRRFELEDPELDLIESWLLQAGVHWGLDSRHRATFAGADLTGHTLAQGLERLFLAYALPDAPGAAFQGLWPAGHVQGHDSLTLGKLWQFFSLVAEFSARLASPLSPVAWRSLLDDLLARCLAVAPADVDDLLSLRGACAAFFSDLSCLDPASSLPAEVFIRSLQEALETPLRGAVPSGSITFAAPGSLRHLPFRVVAILGLDDGAFPGASRPPEFDLMAQAPRLGDRQRRDDDRGIFLDLVLAARDRLLLGTSAFSIHDNSPLTPSVLLSELIETLERALGREASRSLRVEHPLQAFDLRVFLPDTDARMRSHDRQTAQAWQHALLLLQSGQAADGPAPLIAAHHPAHPAPNAQGTPIARPNEPLNDTLTEPLTIPIPELIAALCNPARALLQARARLTLKPPPVRLQDQEPLVAERKGLNRLRRQAAQGMVREASGPDRLDQGLLDQGRQAPGIPAGWLGVQTVTQALQSAARYADRLRQARQGPGLPEYPVDRTLRVGHQQVKLTGALASLWPQGQILALESASHAQALLTGWVWHLALCIESPAGVAHQTQVHTLDQVHGWRPHEHAQDRLTALIDLYLQILREPVPFFAASSLAAAAEDENALKAHWAPRFGPWTGESGTPEVQRVWRGQADPTQHKAFRPLAQQVFADLLAHHQDLGRV